MTVEVPARKASAEQVAEGWRYNIPMRTQVVALFVLPVWLVGWGVGEVLVARQVLAGKGGPMPFLAIWLIFWTYGGLMAIYTWLMQAIGRERVTLTASALTIKRDVTGFEPTREYELVNIRNLRVSPLPYSRRRSPSKSGPIAFDYGAKTYRFGVGLDESEATAIVAELKSRYAFGDLSGGG